MQDKSDLECGVIFQGIVKTWMFSHSEPWMALKRPLKYNTILQSTYFQYHSRMPPLI